MSRSRAVRRSIVLSVQPLEGRALLSAAPLTPHLPPLPPVVLGGPVISPRPSIPPSRSAAFSAAAPSSGRSEGPDISRFAHAHAHAHSYTGPDAGGAVPAPVKNSDGSTTIPEHTVTEPGFAGTPLETTTWDTDGTVTDKVTGKDAAGDDVVKTTVWNPNGTVKITTITTSCGHIRWRTVTWKKTKAPAGMFDPPSHWEASVTEVNDGHDVANPTPEPGTAPPPVPPKP